MTGREILVCTDCKSAIFVDSVANTAPRFTGNFGDHPENREMIDGQDDLRDFKRTHRKHKVIEVKLKYD
ncbi:MAG: hypothetical protein A2Y98_01570 [Candidatus Portnoybacteria bacterium RBG_19FT_COMBO_36_7]|uniref:Uncharacterized protein n=1 Tax=Candidatus Portnoybacteria bacterium RBG_19FT_COMBO_36_7 TaxID=1801992 RepID=A0A1G2F6I9_9BACT|nr:MAG: hypothetical protein A2Y98_01570 [Candidatus Portnoybacteria bacterium RBG_19FT_COMBO_36_7]